MTIEERASKYLAAMEPSISGGGGHNACFAAASALVCGFLLPEEVALGMLRAEFNPRCQPAWSEGELRHKVRSAMANPPGDKAPGWLVGADRSGYAGGNGSGSGGGGGGAASSRPVAEPLKKRQEYDADAAAAASGGAELGNASAWLAARSPVAPGSVDAPGALSHLFLPGEKVLVFSSEMSQGDYGVMVDGPGKARVYALGGRPGIKGKAVEGLPKGGKFGMWFLNQPVDGEWRPNGNVNKSGDAVMSRRSAPNVTAWRYMVLESDEADPRDWLRLVVSLPLPIAAMYESGGRSIHTLVRVDCRSKPDWDRLRDQLSPMLTRWGADGGALSAVRLTRLPQVLRYNKKAKDGQAVKLDPPGVQRLLWLDPAPTCERIEGRPKVRRV